MSWLNYRAGSQLSQDRCLSLANETYRSASWLGCVRCSTLASPATLPTSVRLIGRRADPMEIRFYPMHVLHSCSDDLGRSRCLYNLVFVLLDDIAHIDGLQATRMKHA
jgi:hypothetical protein